MSREYVVLLVFLIVPFALSQAMPSRKWLTGFFTVSALLACWQFYEFSVMRPSGTGLEGIGLTLLYAMCFGGFIGVITKAITLAQKSKNYPLTKEHFTTLTGFILLVIIPIIYFISIQLIAGSHLHQ